MNINGYLIRSKKENEQIQTEALVRKAFWNIYRPGALEHYVLHTLRQSDVFVPELNFVIEKDGMIIG